MVTAAIIQRIQSAYSKGVQSDDSRLAPRHIYNKMLTLRSKLVSRRAKRKEKLSDWNFTVIPCMEVIESNAHECGCLPQIGCKVYRTKVKLPKPMNDMNKHLIQWVMSIEHSIKYEETTREQERHIKGNKYTSNSKRYLIENGYLYFFGGYPGKAVAVKLLAQDPIEAAAIAQLCDEGVSETSCASPLDIEFPMEEDMVEDMITMSVPELIQVFNSNQEDLTNNTRDNNVETSK